MSGLQRHPVLRVFRSLALVVVAMYLVQVVAVTFMPAFPVARAQHDGQRYQIKRGFGGWLDYVPVIGAVPLVTGEPVRLIIMVRLHPLSGMI